ncbi:MAG: 2,3,4,5-tetrahydropyridine-2,6-dicarboxylate N-succinyltransferase [Persicimonas sp.]
MTRELLDEIDRLFELSADDLGDDAREIFEQFLGELEAGELRAAIPQDDGSWEVQPSVKRGILLGFRLGENEPLENAGPLQFSDKNTYPTQCLPTRERNIRLVPGGSSVRRGAYLGRNVTMMPPAYVNVGAYVDDGTMVDSHALVGSCAQIGKNVHLSAGAQIGGVLEPIGQSPVIIEDDVLVGGNTGVYEGVRVRKGAVIGAGAVLTASTPVFDMVHDEVYRATRSKPLEIPPNAVVIPGSRPARGVFAERHGLHMAALLIIKYRDEKTDAATALEEMLR